MGEMKKKFRILGTTFSLLFLGAALVQFNDPDGLKWVALYGIGLITSVLFLLEKLSRLWAFLLAGFYLVLSVISWPDTFEGILLEKGNVVHVEEAREAMGLMISAIIMLILGLFLVKKEK